MEEWKEITFAPKYEVSNMGRIRNKTTKKVLKPRPPRLNHQQQTIFLRSGMFQKEQHTISQLVYNHWCLKEGEKPSYYYLNNWKVKGNRIGHLDGDETNNSADNLFRY